MRFEMLPAILGDHHLLEGARAGVALDGQDAAHERPARRRRST
jgi:hypothetical protein